MSRPVPGGQPGGQGGVRRGDAGLGPDAMPADLGSSGPGSWHVPACMVGALLLSLSPSPALAAEPGHTPKRPALEAAPVSRSWTHDKPLYHHRSAVSRSLLTLWMQGATGT